MLMGAVRARASGRRSTRVSTFTAKMQMSGLEAAGERQLGEGAGQLMQGALTLSILTARAAGRLKHHA